MTTSYPTITVEEARSIDSAAVATLGISSLLLMENAARGICQLIRRQFPNAKSIVIACGFGNNGGDGLALTRLLAAEDISCHTYLIDADRPLSDDTSANLTLLANCKLPVFSDSNGHQFKTDVHNLGPDDLIVDCLLGTGIKGNPRAPYAEVIEAINRSEAQVLAVDVPSGLNAQTGVAGSPSVIANETITFVGTKVGFESSQGCLHTGRVTVAPIGLPLNWTLHFLQQRRKQESQSDIAKQ